MPLIQTLTDLSLPDVLDIALVSVFAYALLIGLRRVKLRSIAAAVLGLGVVYVVAQVFGLRLTVYLFQLSIALLGIGLVVLYHADLRNAVERLLAGRGSRRGAAGASDGLGEWGAALVAALHEMARRRIGALVVVEGRDDLHRHLTGGTVIEGHVSEALLMSIFDPNSLGHDGAVVIRGDRIAGFQFHLPLSTDFDQLHQRGTRHAAALGLAERADALCLVVSEERGRVSVARDGELRQIEEVGELQRTVEEFVRGIRGERPRPARFWAWSQLRPKLAAVAVAYLLWFVFVHEGQTEYKSYTVPVGLLGLDEGLRMGSAEPSVAKVIVSGPRRAFYLVGPGDVSIEAAAFDLGEGRHELTLNASDIVMPAGVTFTNIFPRIVEVSVVPDGG